jgi:hypothetical protein
MNKKHITEILDEKRFSELTKTDLSLINSHTAECRKCAEDFQAAQVSAVLLNSRSTESFAPSAFFQSKLMTALREKQTIQKPILVFRSWWQASYGLVFAMFLMVVTLVGLTVFAPNSDANEVQVEVSNFNLYSTDNIIINQKPSRDLSGEQTLELIYNERRDSKRK